MRLIVSLLWLSKHKRNGSSPILISRSPLVHSLMVVWSYDMTKLMISWGQASSNPCGMGPTLWNVFCKKGPMILLIMKAIFWINTETSFISRSNMLKSSCMVTCVHYYVIHFCAMWFSVLVFKQLSCLLCFPCFANVCDSSHRFCWWCLP